MTVQLLQFNKAITRIKPLKVETTASKV